MRQLPATFGSESREPSPAVRTVSPGPVLSFILVRVMGNCANRQPMWSYLTIHRRRRRRNGWLHAFSDKDFCIQGPCWSDPIARADPFSSFRQRSRRDIAIILAQRGSRRAATSCCQVCGVDRRAGERAPRSTRTGIRPLVGLQIDEHD